MSAKQLAVLAAILGSVYCAWMLRYTIVSSGGKAYRLDRWNGKVEWIDRDGSFAVQELDAEGKPRVPIERSAPRR